MPRRKKNSQAVTYNQFFGALLIAVGVGALIVFLRYLVITWVMPADVYLIEPSQLVPGMK
jgi:hypothetical protein